MRAEPIGKFLENLRDGCCIVPRSEEGELELLQDKMNGKQDGSAFDSFHSIQLDDRESRVGFTEGSKVVIGSANPAGLVHLERNGFLFSGTEAYFSWHIDVSGFKQTMIGIGIQGFLTAQDPAWMMKQDMVKGVAVPEQGADHLVHLNSFLLGQVESGTGFRADLLIFLLGAFGIIEMFFQGTFVSIRTAIADIRGVPKQETVLFPIVRTVSATLAAETAFGFSFSTAWGTEIAEMRTAASV